MGRRFAGSMGRATGGAEVTMDMTWKNLTKLLTWAVEHGSEASMADLARHTIVMDEAFTKEDWDRFMASHSEPSA